MLEDAAPAARAARPVAAPAQPDPRLPRALQARADRVLRQHGRRRRRPTDPGSSLHYLRTVNPLNPENLAVYPQRVGTNRTNAYAKPGPVRPASCRACSPTRRATAAARRRRRSPTSRRPARRARRRRSVPARRHDHAGRLAGDPAVRAAEPARQPEHVRARPGDRERGSRTVAAASRATYNFSGETTQYPHVKATRRRMPRAPGAAASARPPGTRRWPLRGAARASPAARWRWRAAQPSAATDTLVGQRHGRVPGDRALPPSASATTRSSCSCAATLPQLVLTENLDTLLGLEGCLSGNKPQGVQAAGRARTGRARELARTKPAQGRLRPGHVHQLGRRRDPGQFQAQHAHAGRAQAQRAGDAARKIARAQGRSTARGQNRPRRPRQARLRAVPSATCCSSTSATASACGCRSSTTRTSSPRWCSTRRAARRRRRRASPTCSRARSRR